MAEDVFNRAGLRLQRKRDVWSVSAVYAGGPAADAGVKVGDVVSRVDGHGPDTLSKEQL
jgi:C-terminal processing protease CtpA/Prc